MIPQIYIGKMIDEKNGNNDDEDHILNVSFRKESCRGTQTFGMRH